MTHADVNMASEEGKRICLFKNILTTSLKLTAHLFMLQVLGQTAKTILANHFAYSAKEWKI